MGVDHAAEGTKPQGLLGVDAYDIPVTIACDPREWDVEYLSKVGEILKNTVMPIDSKGMVDRGVVVSSLLLSLLPEHSEMLLRDEEGAAESEIADEQKAYGAIRAGLRAAVPEGGSMDYASRSAMYEQMLQANPSVFDDMAPDKRQLLQERMEALAFQAEQMRNAEIGRTGVEAKVGAIGMA